MQEADRWLPPRITVETALCGWGTALQFALEQAQATVQGPVEANTGARLSCPASTFYSALVGTTSQ